MGIRIFNCARAVPVSTSVCRSQLGRVYEADLRYRDWRSGWAGCGYARRHLRKDLQQTRPESECLQRLPIHNPGRPYIPDDSYRPRESYQHGRPDRSVYPTEPGQHGPPPEATQLGCSLSLQCGYRSAGACRRGCATLRASGRRTLLRLVLACT